MKAKTNLELFKNEIVYGLKHGIYDKLYVAMYDIYKRETGDEKISYDNVLDWFSDVPRETLELSKEMYDFLQAYYDSFMDEEYYIDNYAGPAILIDIGIIPKKYKMYKVGDFMKIIKVKKEFNK